MTKMYFTELANYNNWTDSLVIDWLKKITDEQWNQRIESSFPSIRQTAIHMASAKKIWLDFWTKNPNPTYFSSHFNGTKEELIAIWEEASSDFKNCIESFPEENYDKPVTFIYPNGQEGQMMFWQTLPHYVNHATYHRGQLLTLLRQAGFTEFSNSDLATYFSKSNNNALKAGPSVS